jgi:methylmalonyl-CoA mutase N-terminal domain/subunit
VGLNIFQIPEQEDTLLKEVVESKIEPYRSRIEKIERFKKSRDQTKIKKVLKGVWEKADEQKENLVRVTAEALLAGATMGEIAGMMRIAYGYPYDPHGMIESPV